jgi:hypothetical protein
MIERGLFHQQRIPQPIGAMIFPITIRRGTTDDASSIVAVWQAIVAEKNLSAVDCPLTTDRERAYLTSLVIPAVSVGLPSVLHPPLCRSASRRAKRSASAMVGAFRSAKNLPTRSLMTPRELCP